MAESRVQRKHRCQSNPCQRMAEALVDGRIQGAAQAPVPMLVSAPVIIVRVAGGGGPIEHLVAVLWCAFSVCAEFMVEMVRSSIVVVRLQCLGGVSGVTVRAVDTREERHQSHGWQRHWLMAESRVQRKHPRGTASVTRMAEALVDGRIQGAAQAPERNGISHTDGSTSSEQACEPTASSSVKCSRRRAPCL
jgi:hypothetical protein